MLVPSFLIPEEHKTLALDGVAKEACHSGTPGPRRYWGLIIVRYDIEANAENTFPEAYWCLERHSCGKEGLWENFQPGRDEDPYVFRTLGFAQNKLEELQATLKSYKLTIAVWVHPECTDSFLLRASMLQYLDVRKLRKAEDTYTSYVQSHLRQSKIDPAKTLTRLGKLYVNPRLENSGVTGISPAEQLEAAELALTIAVYSTGAKSRETLAALQQLAGALYVISTDGQPERFSDAIEAYAAAALLAEEFGTSVHIPLNFEAAVARAKNVLLLHEADLKICLVSDGHENDWVELYEHCFPDKERVPVEILRQDIASGKRILHRTLSATGELLCFSLAFTQLDEFVWLSYIATAPDRRSLGIGTVHLTKLLQLCQAQFPERKGLLFEIESTKIDLNPNQLKMRQRRKYFYERLGALPLFADIRYLIPAFVADEDPIEAELFCYLFPSQSVENIDSKATLNNIFNKVYHLPTNHPHRRLFQ